MRSMVVVALLASAAHADDVNLLTTTPTTVAVSSTVANAAILPDHLVDGKLSTAWNSQTGELEGAWIAVRVPADTHVKTIKLTAGFTHKDKKLGDLFTQNPRIKKIRITAGDKTIDKVLDADNRGLHEIAVDIPGGDFEIRVLQVVPGTKKQWREVCVSELEVWGTAPAPSKKKLKPSVRVRSLDAPPVLTREQCIKAVGAVDGKITSAEAIPLSDAITVCRVDHKEKGSTTVETEIVAVKRAGASVIGAPIHEAVTVEDRPNEGTGDAGNVKVVVLPLTVFEKGLVVHTTERAYGPMSDTGKTVSKLYRAQTTAFDEILSWETKWDDGESTDGDTCELAAFDLRKTMPNLTLECVTTHGHFHDDNPDDRGIDEKRRKHKFRWSNGKYEER